jgi:(E)-4-hydroxy-3-methylbut-2-enyl-diphosphate synthase
MILTLENNTQHIGTNFDYCPNLTKYVRRESLEVNIGNVPLGGDNPIRIQSMTTVDTMDTIGSVEQSIRMIEAGCEYVRLTAPSLKEAQNLEDIKKELRNRGYETPLVADIHFTPNAAELAARIVEKVRVNPGNYADRKKFEEIEYNDASYEAELDRIRAKFTPLVTICKEYGTAMRIGTNHGSLSDRIMSRYGDTPMGMVESALEFLRICEDLNYYEIVLSMKASNPQVMVQAYRLLVNRMDAEGLKPYPLHLGVTEAGEGEDGRIKSAAGIGTLLEDGLGDTVRVSLTEEPEFEAPVAKALVERYTERKGHSPIPSVTDTCVNPFEYNQRSVKEVANFGADNVPRVIADFSQASEELEYKHLKSIGHHYLPELDKWAMSDNGADFIYTGNQPAGFMLPNGLQEILDYDTWTKFENKENKYPILPASQFVSEKKNLNELAFVTVEIGDLNKAFLDKLEKDPSVVLVLNSSNAHAMPEIRRAFFLLMERKVNVPVVISRNYENIPADHFQLYASTDAAALLLDGLGDGVMFSFEDRKLANQTAFGVLQAARRRITKTEYISCPSCGRTLFDLQETTAMIRKRTDHLKGVKIGIMGCIVNGPGEMADADFGYVGSGVDKITLYKGKEVVRKAVPSAEAVDALIELIREDGRWIEPTSSPESTLVG